MFTPESHDDAVGIQQILLLVWVHGFAGDESTFADFPEDVCRAAQTRFEVYDIHSIFYPTYKTVGELEVATEAFVSWLHQYVNGLEAKQVDKTDRIVQTKVILFGHSMGGMLVADAAKLIHDQREKHPNEKSPDVKGVIAIDTPFLGIHPALASYGAEQFDAFMDKTLLDTAAFFENSSKVFKSGMKRIGISTDKLDPIFKSPSTKVSHPGGLTQSMSSLLSIPSRVSSSEWDWITESRGGGWKGLKRVISGQGGLVLDQEAVEMRFRDKKERKDKKRSKKTECKIKKQEVERDQKEREAEWWERYEASRGSNGRQLNSDMAKSISDKGMRSVTDKLAATSLDDSTNSALVIPTLGPIVPPALPPRRGSGQSVSRSSSPIGTLVCPSLPPRRQSNSSGVTTYTPILHPPTPDTIRSSKLDLIRSANSSTPSMTDSFISEANSTIGQSTTAQQAKQKKNLKWLKSHMHFMSSCWRVGEITRRMKGIDMMQRKGLYFVNIYTVVRPKPPLYPKDRIFVSLPTIHHPTKENWKEFIHESAADQVEAHMGLFNKRKHRGYGRLIRVICDEIGEVLK